MPDKSNAMIANNTRATAIAAAIAMFVVNLGMIAPPS
jgi:hypothetical protein